MGSLGVQERENMASNCYESVKLSSGLRAAADEKANTEHFSTSPPLP